MSIRLIKAQCSLDSVKILFRLGLGGKIIPRIRLSSAKVVVEVDAELDETYNHNMNLIHTGEIVGFG